MSHAAEMPVELKHDSMTNTMSIRVLGGIENVPTEEVIQRLESSCRASRARKKIGDIVPLIDDDGVACRVRLRSALVHYDELDVRDALSQGGFVCV